MESKIEYKSFKEKDLILYLAGELDEQKKIQIENWILADEKNRRIYLQLIAIWNINKTRKDSESIDLEASREKIFKKTLRSEIKRAIYIYQKIAAVLLLPIIGTVLFFFPTVSPLSFNKTKMSNAKAINEVSVAYGMRLNVVLPDGTKVWLNSGSNFKYPNQFSGNTRAVYLEGEGYFEIVENKKVPFVINTKGGEIVATGTIVDVLAYPDDNLIETTLLKGKVYLNSQSGKNFAKPLAVLNSGEKVIFNKENQTIRHQKIDSKDVISWTNGYLVFDNDSFDEVARKLSRWYNTDIILINGKLKSYTYTATFVDETIFQVMELLKLSAPIDYKISGRTKMTGNTFSKRKVEIWMK
jgi:transmembrane sensor